MIKLLSFHGQSLFGEKGKRVRNFIIFHLLFFVGGVLLFFGVTFVPMKVEEWSKAALGEDSRLASALWGGTAIIVYGGLAALAIYVYYAIGFTVWAGAGRYWHSHFLFWKGVLGF